MVTKFSCPRKWRNSLSSRISHNGNECRSLQKREERTARPNQIWLFSRDLVFNDGTHHIMECKLPGSELPHSILLIVESVLYFLDCDSLSRLFVFCSHNETKRALAESLDHLIPRRYVCIFVSSQKEDLSMFCGRNFLVYICKYHR